MKTVPCSFHGAVDRRAQRMAGWTRRQRWDIKKGIFPRPQVHRAIKWLNSMVNWER